MSKIRLLPDEIAHKIAAGEVIERPASVVKELIENSIDAESSNITVEITAGGTEYIRVQDDGEGIACDDIKMAFQPHATSKISSVDDLFALYTLGFRGEALPSIASVSHLALMTRPEKQDYAYKAVLKDGEITLEPVGAPYGTTVEVRDLFHNVPARYKFLKSAAAERRRVVELVTDLAVAHPHIAFRLITDNKLVLSTQGSGKLLDALMLLHGKDIGRDLLAVNSEFKWGTVQGYIGTPRLAKGNRSGQVLVMNGRVIQNNTIRAALEKAYYGVLPSRRYPFAVLTLSVDPKFVDCNVHPAKAEVRFANDQDVFGDVLHAIRSSLSAKNLAPALEAAPSAERTRSSYKQASKPIQAELQWEPETWEFVDELLREYRPQHNQREHNQRASSSESPSLGSPPLGSSSKPDNSPAEPRQHPLQSELSQGEMSSDVRKFLRTGRIIGQLHQSYILLEVPTGLWLLDQHIIHERILYEKFRNSADNRTVHVQEILPELLEFSPADSQLVVEYVEDLREFGLELEPFGTNAFLLRTVPSLLSTSTEGWKKDILEVINGVQKGISFLEQSSITLACKGAVKAGDFLNEQAIRSLLNELAETANPFTCPHGRPIIVRLENKEILRRFGRTESHD